MGLNPSTGNMYDFVTHTWNTIKGACPHACAYCYMRRFKNQKPVRFDEKELKTDLGAWNFIFVGSGCDLFADDIPRDWIRKTIERCNQFANRYLFQSKNPERMSHWLSTKWAIQKEIVVCTTIETNRFYDQIMGKAPLPDQRVFYLEKYFNERRRFVTIEPIMDFDLSPLVELVRRCEPEQVNIGADSGGNHLPEPSAAQVERLIEELQKFTRVERKKNLARITGKEV